LKVGRLYTGSIPAAKVPWRADGGFLTPMKGDLLRFASTDMTDRQWTPGK
jgi:hypothetical protein